MSASAVCGMGIALACLAAAPKLPAQIVPLPDNPFKLDAEELKLVEGKRTGDDDLRGQVSGKYIGGIDREWALVVSGPPLRRFHYYFTEFASLRVEGTYEAKHGLAVFTGTATSAPIFDKAKAKAGPIAVRFALTYLHVGDKVHFNVLRPAAAR